MLEIKQRVKIIEGCRAPLPDEILTSAEPVVLKGLVRDWPIVQAGLQSRRHAADYILKFYNGQPLVAFLGAPDIDGRMFYNEDMSGFNYQQVRGKLDELLAELFKRLDEQDDAAMVPSCYVGSTSVDHWLPGFRQHNDLGLAVNDPLVSIWMGNQSRVAAHYDFPSNIACCVVGHRRFTLFPPEQLSNLYVGPIDFTPAGQAISLVDFANPDFERYPRFREALASAQLAELEPGDALVVPSMWWHHVESLDPFNVLVNYWWRNTPDYMGSPFDVLQLALLGLKDLPEEQRRAWQNIFDFYVFNATHNELDHIPESRRGVLAPVDPGMAKSIRARLVNNLKNVQ